MSDRTPVSPFDSNHALSSSMPPWSRAIIRNETLRGSLLRRDKRQVRMLRLRNNRRGRCVSCFTPHIEHERAPTLEAESVDIKPGGQTRRRRGVADVSGDTFGRRSGQTWTVDHPAAVPFRCHPVLDPPNALPVVGNDEQAAAGAHQCVVRTEREDSDSTRNGR